MGLFSDRNIKSGIIISGFAGIGKTGLQEYAPFYSQKKIFDLSSSFFRKNPGWEKVYCDLIESVAKNYDYVFISTHNMVIDELINRQIKFYVVYPRKYCKDEYIQRYFNRGNSEEYINKFVKNWDFFIDMLDNLQSDYKITLRTGQYLSDVIDRLR